MNNFLCGKYITSLSNYLYENRVWAIRTRCSSFLGSLWLFLLHVLLWTFFVSALHTYIFFLLTFKDVSLLSHHPKYQLSTCISIGLCQGLPSHIFSIYVSLCVLFQTFHVFLNIFCVTFSPWVILYGSMFIYIPTLWFYNPVCDQPELFYNHWYILYKEWQWV